MRSFVTISHVRLQDLRGALAGVPVVSGNATTPSANI